MAEEPITLPDLGPMYDAVGKGISIFSLVETYVTLIFAELLYPADSARSIATLNAARSFEAKMKMVDALAAEALKGEDLTRWRSLSSKIGRRKDIRDKLAHWMVAPWPGIKTAADAAMSKAALVPPIWKQEHWKVMWLPQSERKVQPLFLSDLEQYGRKTTELAMSLLDFCNHLEAHRREKSP
jgi:hypothetical protein